MKVTITNYLTQRLAHLNARSMNRRLELLDKFSSIHLLVIGDLMLDRFIWGEVERSLLRPPFPCSGRVGGRPPWRRGKCHAEYPCVLADG